MPDEPVIDVENVRERLAKRFGPEVAGWCAGLPGLAEGLAARWGLRLGTAWPMGGTSVVLPCESGAGEPLVLKLTPDPVIAATEAAALDAWAGSRHVVSLRDADPGRGALLLERVLPGTRLAAEEEQWPLDETVPVLEDLWRPAPLGLPGLGERAEFLLDMTSERLARYPEVAARVPPGLVERSRSLSRALAAGGPAMLVHGDLHSGNVLRSGDGRLVAIDPRPCVGDPAFDVIDWALADGGGEPAVRRRIDYLAARLDGLDPDRAWGWCQAMAVAVGVIWLIVRPGEPGGEEMVTLGPKVNAVVTGGSGETREWGAGLDPFGI